MTEVEIKLLIGPVEPELQLLQSLNAVLVQPRAYEENVLLDLPGLSLRSRGAMLRVRRFAGLGTLTYKEPAPGHFGYKVRREVEVGVSDPGLMLQILESAGFLAIWRYAKYRTVFLVNDLQVLVDETPIGNYLELEGAPEAIDAFARRLGRSPSDYIQGTYRSLHERWCRERDIPPGDLLFSEGASL